MAAGFVWLSEVAELHRVDLLQIPNVGVKTVAALADVLADFGQAFRGETLTEVA